LILLREQQNIQDNIIEIITYISYMEDILSRLAANCPHLTELDLSYKNIGFSKVKVLAEILEKNNHLISLNLEGNNIGNKGAQTLSAMLEKNNTLQKINLVNNKIEDEGARALGKIIARRKVHTNISLLKKFFISGCYDNTVYHMIAPLGK
jgi:Ran GTPase-activating protein (RanGAP) involved in mRNA processing and transport